MLKRASPTGDTTTDFEKEAASKDRANKHMKRMGQMIHSSWAILKIDPSLRTVFPEPCCCYYYSVVINVIDFKLGFLTSVTEPGL